MGTGKAEREEAALALENWGRQYFGKIWVRKAGFG